jgi:hypothetical protein
MPLSPADASAALSDVAAAEARSRAFRGYQSASPHLIIWGAAWAFAYAVSDLAPHWTNPTWLGVVALATGGDILAARADRQRRARDTGGAGFAGLFGIFFVFIASTMAIMQPKGTGQVGAFIPLVVAASYAVIGLMDRPRMLVLGGTLAALTLFGFFALPAHFLLWMAVVGGGSLILGGLWLRQV